MPRDPFALIAPDVLPEPPMGEGAGYGGQRHLPWSQVDHEVQAGETALIWAARRCHIDCIMLLLSAGANPLYETRRGVSAISEARDYGQIQVRLPSLPALPAS